jgi:hypothetical protein
MGGGSPRGRARAACFGLWFALVSSPAAGQSRAGPPTLAIPRVATPPRLEDYLDGRERDDEVRVTGFRQNRPGDGEPVSQETTAYLSYDDRHLYVVFVCKDREPSKIRARLTRREQFFGDDLVGVALDTFSDRRRAYLFLANPLGVQGEGILTEGQGDDFSFDTLWASRGRLTPDGYVVWMAIPFKSLRFPAAPRQRWGILLGRIIPRANEQSFWPFVTSRLEGFIQQFATATGLERISPGRHVQLIPFGTALSARLRDEETAASRIAHDARAGVDAKLVVRDAVTVDLAVNPDFSQVESDEPQVTVNQRFEVFFPEKRPFFLENAAFFATPVPLFFSRRVVDPQWGGRVSGKAAGWAFGALAIDDRAPARQARPAAGDPTRAAIQVVRVQREVAEQSGVGVLVTSRRVGSAWNRVLAADARVKLGPNWVVTAQAAASASGEADEARRGAAYEIRLTRGGRHLWYNLAYRDISPHFRADLGFVPRIDLRQIDQFVAYQWRPRRGRLVAFGPSLFASALADHSGRLQDWVVRPQWRFEWKGQTELEVGPTEALERFEGIDFRRHATRVFFRTEALGWLVWSTSYTWGTGINFVPAEGLAPFLADSVTLRSGLSIRPVPRLTYEQTYIFTRLATRPSAVPMGMEPGVPIFTNHLARARVNVQFTRAWSLRVIVDFSGVARNATLAALDPRKRLTADVLLAYQLNPWSAVYVGYTDTYENLVPGLAGPLGRLAAPTTSVARQLFVKTSYLLRF